MHRADVVIRRAEAKDAAAILDMARELAVTLQDPAPRIDVARLIEDVLGDGRWGDCFIVEDGGSAVAYALACRAFEVHTGERRLWLGDLYVRAEARRRGVGQALMAALARHALGLGCTAIYWELWRQNRVGESFYHRLGAERSEELCILRLAGERPDALARES